MERRDIDPRRFGEHLGYNHAVLVESPRRWLLLAGHEARDEHGRITAHGDIVRQMELTLERLAETAGKAGFTLADVVQIRVFTTDLEAFKAEYDSFNALLEARDCRPAALLAEVKALSLPSMLVEIEAVAVQ
ncbi:enamine deaminase RidA [Actinomadura logoneensis]|uniref:Enamine deaminase RidA n=1 Tax=Actinomadura logoneensis TaxID=2293572 RepID=A0A372JP75_9ACTN|nr:Rid family hydrolase [Actinomadura logoneensis]RFU41759.1 enamine deaminase RidA [Actinomadura logoneensis]